MTSAVKVLRVHLVPGPVAVLWPWLILAISFVVNLAIFGLTDVPVGNRTTGGLGSIYCTIVFATMALITQTFPFMVGLNVTRSAFLAGTGLFLLGQSLAAGAVLTALDALEHATGGWGVHMQFFGAGFVDRDNVVAQFLVYAVPYLTLSFLGLALGMTLKRWGAQGMYLLSVALLLLGGAVVVVVGWNHWWGQVGRFFTTTDVLALTAGYPAVMAFGLAALTYLGLRRASVWEG